MKKLSIIAAIVSLMVFCIIMVIAGHNTEPVLHLLCFQLVILWLCNEVWQRILSLPGVVSLLFSAMGRVKPQATAKIGGILYRISTVTLILAPHLFYLLLFAADAFFDQVASNTTGITFTHTLFACSWCSIVPFWLIALVCRIEPLSITKWIPHPFDLKNIAEKAYDARQIKKPLHPRDTPAVLSAIVAQEILPMHRELLSLHLQDDEQVLLATRPVADTVNKHTGIPQPFFAATTVSSVFLFMFCVNVIQQANGMALVLALIIMGTLCIVFSACSIYLFKVPAKWRHRLNNVSYVVTDKRLFIFEQSHVQAFSLSEKLFIHAELVRDDIGIIYISRPGLADAMAGLVLGKFAQQAPDKIEGHVALNHPLPGFLNCPDADNVFAMIESLRSHC